MRHRPIHGWMRRQGWQPPTHRHRDRHRQTPWSIERETLKSLCQTSIVFCACPTRNPLRLTSFFLAKIKTERIKKEKRIIWGLMTSIWTAYRAHPMSAKCLWNHNQNIYKKNNKNKEKEICSTDKKSSMRFGVDTEDGRDFVFLLFFIFLFYQSLTFFVPRAEPDDPACLTYFGR